MSEEQQIMECPMCSSPHQRGEYQPRPDIQKEGEGTPHCPPDVNCDCGTTLRMVVPIFALSAAPYGWKWGIVDKKDKFIVHH